MICGPVEGGSRAYRNAPGTVRAYCALRGRERSQHAGRPCDSGGHGAPIAVASPVTADPRHAGLTLIAAWVPADLLAGRPAGFSRRYRPGVGIGLRLARDAGGPAPAPQPGGLAPAEPGSLGLITVVDSGLYAVLDYRVHHGQLPLGAIAVFLRGSIATPLILLFPLVILLFPDGRLTWQWRWMLWPYLVLVVAGRGGRCRQRGRHHRRAAHPGRHDRDVFRPGGPTGALGAVLAGAGAGLVVVPLFWLAFAARQVVSWRRATGERRQQLKWLTSGAVIAVIGLALIAVGPPKGPDTRARSPMTWPSWLWPRCRSAWVSES